MILPMQKFNIVIEKNKKEKLLAFLQQRGDVEVTAVKTKEKEEPEGHDADFILAELDFVLDLFKEKVKEEKTSMFSKIGKALAGPKEFSRQDFEKQCQDFRYQEVIKRAKDLDNNLAKSEVEERELSENLEIMTPWESLGLAPGDLETESTLSTLGTIEERDLAHLQKVINGEVNIRKVKKEGAAYFIVITYLKSNQDKFLVDLNNTGFTLLTLPGSQSPEAEISKIKNRLKEIKKSRQKILKEIQRMGKERERIEMLYDYLSNQKRVKDAEGTAQDTVYTSLLELWASKGTFKILKRILPEEFPSVFVEKIKKKKGERVPVVIYNKKYMEPFEAVTRVYGMPKAEELDPTPYLSVFFAVFFGMCLSDAGYGLILLLLSVLSVKFLKLSKDFKRLLKLMTYCSVTTIAVGVLYGAYFGIALSDLSSSFFRDLLLRAQVIDPIKSPLQIMGIALVFGFIQFWFAKAINVKYLLGRGKVKEALLGDFIWVLAIGALLFFGLTKIFFPSLASMGLYTLLAAAGLLIITQGHKQKNVLLKFATGVLSLYDLVGMLSHILSYSRLLALGLTTSVIALVVNVIALLVRDMIPYAGVVVMVLVLIGGHLFNIAINILGGFIHSARLQYVEFFPKFMEGGGRIFKPLKKEYKYAKVKEKIPV